MTLEEACSLLGISPDEDLDINQLEENYDRKVVGLTPQERKRIDEACEYLLKVYDDIYGSEKFDSRSRDATFMKLAVLMAGVFVLCFGIVVFFVYKVHSDNVPKNDTAQVNQDYELLRAEVERLKAGKSSVKPDETQIAHVNETPTDYAVLIEKAMPSMVFIMTNKGTGSGFFVSNQGDILTNYHVIENVEYISITTQSGQVLSALVKGVDTVRDMALLKVNVSSPVPFLIISDTLPKQGEFIMAIGNPSSMHHIYDNTVSDGIVSAIRKVDNNLWVQFTASVSPGSSGGAVINLQGNVVGMTTWRDPDVGSQNINFAVPSTTLKQFIISTVNKPARTLPKPQKPQPARQQHRDIPGAKFIARDDGYLMYLDTKNIDYNRQTQVAAFVTLWWPTEKSKKQMRQDPHFNIPPNQDLGLCILLYVANFKTNKYVHLRTVNLCTDGETIARDYIRPEKEIVWRTPRNGSRIQLLMREIKRQLRLR